MIALSLLDLAQGCQKKEFYDLDYVIKCAEKVLEYFPNNINAMILKTEAKRKVIKNSLLRKNSDFSKAKSYPVTGKLLLEIQNDLAKIHELGYRPMPEEMYLNWLISLKGKREKYSNKKITALNSPN